MIVLTTHFFHPLLSNVQPLFSYFPQYSSIAIGAISDNDRLYPLIIFCWDIGCKIVISIMNERITWGCDAYARFELQCFLSVSQ